ncbi:fumarylacetoacetate hydrolase family protein [Spongisporangium articulatum]|uniref:Fumarylacetoacetate hydrolase family protein n=1 Tax=Spongisporangium articulatum TaxID=3362603 RepID=A0ABW8AN28_9ACTN
MVPHLARFHQAGSVDFGLVVDGGIVPFRERYATLPELIEAEGRDVLAAKLSDRRLGLDEVTLLAPTTLPCRVLCQGVNYRQHAIESGLDPDHRAFNLFFDKTDAAVTGPLDPVVRPGHVRLLDFEIELALVIGKRIDAPVEVTDANLHEYVYGVVIANDLSARDVQLPQGQYLKGKSYRGFCPVGPYLAVLGADTVGLLDDLDLRLEVNGQVRQEDNTRNLVYRPAETLTELSTFANLDPGDLLLTGTPHGVVAKAPHPIVHRLARALLPEDRLWSAFVRTNLSKPYLQPGDVVESTIRSRDGRIDLGRQRNRITAPEPSPAGKA